jgi:hypothetical protein
MNYFNYSTEESVMKFSVAYADVKEQVQQNQKSNESNRIRCTHITKTMMGKSRFNHVRSRYVRYECSAKETAECMMVSRTDRGINAS